MSGLCCDLHDAPLAGRVYLCAPDDLGGYCCDLCPTLARDEPDDDAGHGDTWQPIETVDTGGLT